MSEKNAVAEKEAQGAPVDEEKRRRGRRNLAVAAALAAFIGLIYLITIVRLGGNVADRSF
ncbi:MAG: hypothetical protein AAGL49_04960 [Pseudomonadota bacterium]